MRKTIARKEAKELIRWLMLLIVEDPELEKERSRLLNESEELRKILSAIINKLP